MTFTRRGILTALSAAAATFAFPAVAATPSIEEVGVAFREMPREVRLIAQANLIANAFYLGPQDGEWGPGTAEGFRQLMALDVYRDFATTLPADRMEAARATVLWAAPENFAD